MRNAMQVVNVLLEEDPAPGPRLSGPRGWAPSVTAGYLVRVLLDEGPLPKSPVCEASVYLPRRGRIWVATFTGPQGGQTWRSTGRTNRDQAMIFARRWEAQARV